MTSFLSSALGGVNNLSDLVDRVSQIKDNIERTLDNAVGEGSNLEPSLPSAPLAPIKTPDLESLRQQSDDAIVKSVMDDSVGNNEDITQNDDEANGKAMESQVAISEMGDVHETEVIPESSNTEDLKPDVLTKDKTDGTHVPQETPEDQLPSTVSPEVLKREQMLQDTLKRREAQLEQTSRQLAEQEEQLNALREALNNASVDKRVRAAEARADGLMKEGMILAEKQGKAEQALRKVRKEKEELETREKSLSEMFKREQEARKTLEAELTELRDVRKRGEASIAQISESNADATRRLEEARTQAIQAERREQEMKSAMEQTFAEVAEQKKVITSLTQQLNAAKRDAEHAKFQLKEQLDSRHLHGSRADSMEKSLAEAKLALEEHVKESRQIETDLRAQLNRANEQLRIAEKKLDEAAARSLELNAPLLRQIDLLNEQRAKQEEAASALLTRAVSAEAAEAEMTAARRKSEQARSELAVRISELESLLTAAKADASRSQSDCKIALKRAEEAERERDAIQKQMDTLRASSDTKIAEHRMTEMQLRQSLALEMEKYERTKRTWEDRAKESEERYQVELRRVKQQQQEMQFTTPGVPSTPGVASSTPHQMSNPTPKSNLDHPSSPPSASLVRRVNSDASSVYSASTTAFTATQDEILGNVLYGEDVSATATIDFNSDGTSRYLLQASELQAGIRRRDARIKLLQDQLGALMKQKDDLAAQVVSLEEKVRTLEASAGREKSMALEIAKLQQQSTLLMELLGEKEEQIEVLNMDLEVVKTKFREQIDVLLKG